MYLVYIDYVHVYPIIAGVVESETKHSTFFSCRQQKQNKYSSSITCVCCPNIYKPFQTLLGTFKCPYFWLCIYIQEHTLHAISMYDTAACSSSKYHTHIICHLHTSDVGEELETQVAHIRQALLVRNRLHHPGNP